MDNCNWLRVRPFVDETLQISRVKNLNIPRSSGEIGLNCKKRVIVETRRFESYRWGGRNDQQRTEVHAFPNLDLDEIRRLRYRKPPPRNPKSNRPALQVGPGRRSDSATTFPPLSRYIPPPRVSRKPRIDPSRSISTNSPSKSDFSRERQRQRARGRGEEDVAEKGCPCPPRFRSFPWREGRVSLAFTALGVAEVEGEGEAGG